MRATCIADKDTVRGFRLAGVAGQAVATLEETAEAFARAVERPDCDLLIATDEVVARLGPELAALRLERSRPLIVEIPGPAGSQAGVRRESLDRLVQRVLGTSLGGER